MPELTKNHPYNDPDLNNVAPIQQKRILAFVNHYLTTMVQFLNNFAVTCEEKMQNFEEKIQKVEASLLILEAKLSSIPELDTRIEEKKEISKESQSKAELKDVSGIDSNIPNEKDTLDDSSEPAEKDNVVNIEEIDNKPKDDPQYKRFFKMLHVGVPLNAVKLKMQIEGLDPSVLSM